MSSFAFGKDLSAASWLAMILLVEMVVRVLVIPALLDVKVCGVDGKLLVAFAHFSSAGVFAVGTGNWIVPVFTGNWAVESVRIGLGMRVALDVGLFNARVASSEKSAVEIHVIRWATFSSGEDVV